MKTAILSLFLLGFTSLSFTQNELAMVKHTNKSLKKNKIEKTSMDYTTVINASFVSERIQKLHRLVNNYNIKTNPIYTPETPSTYSVNFTEGRNKITAEYDHNGKVVKSYEVFNQVRLPYAISQDLAKSYPGWEFSKVQCQINYVNNTSEVLYKVVLKLDRQKKTVTLNAADYLM